MASKGGGRSPFVDVTPPGRRPPSWINKHKAPGLDVRSLRPAPIPKEFVDAVQAEMALNAARLDESVALHRATRPPSEIPPARADLGLAKRSTRAPSSTPRGGGPATQEPAASQSATEPFSSELSLPTSASGSMRAVLAANGPQYPDPEAMEALRLAIDNLVHARSVVFETAAAQIAELAATIARRVISTELSLRPEIVRKLVDEGLRALEKEDHVLVRLGSGFSEQQARLVEDFRSQGEQIEVVVDPALSTFGCVVETDHGWVDESIESRLATLLHELRSDEVQSDELRADHWASEQTK